MTISETAVKAAYGAYVTFIEEGGSVPVIDAVRAALTAALPFLPVQGAVKKMEWRKGVEFGAITAHGAGVDYTIWSDLSLSISPMSPREYHLARIVKAEDQEAAKAAAQQDYEARILSALEPSAARDLLKEAAQIAEDYVQYDVASAIRALSSPDHADAGKVEGDGIERGKFYHHHWPMEKLLEARRDGLVDHSGGEAWRYEYSHKDEHGKYDILYRPVKNTTIPARLPSAPSEGAE